MVCPWGKLLYTKTLRMLKHYMKISFLDIFLGFLDEMAAEQQC